MGSKVRIYTTNLAIDDKEIGCERSIPSWPRRLGRLSIPLYATVLFILITISVVSVSVALFDIKDDHNVHETDLELPSLPHQQNQRMT